MTDLGKIAITLEGVFNPEIIYNKLDQVTDNGSSYTSKIDNNDQPLSNFNAWQISALKGIDGMDGIDGNNGTNAQSFNFKNSINNYSELPSIENIINDAYYNLDDNLLYVYNGTSFPIEGEGITLQGSTEISDWIAQYYVEKSLVIKDDLIYRVADGETATATDVPGLSAVWVVLGNNINTEGYITPSDFINITVNAGNITFIIPIHSTITSPNYQYINLSSITINEVILKPSYFVINKITNTFSFIAYDINTDFSNFVILGFLNPFDQRQFLNSSLWKVNGIEQAFKAFPDISKPYTYNLEAFSSQKMSTLLGKIGTIFRREVDFSSTFPFFAIKELNVLSSPNPETDWFTSGNLKDLYFTFARKIGGGNGSTIFHIGEKIGSSVGVGQNLFASVASTDANSGIQTLILEGNAGLKLELVVDLAEFTFDSFSLTTEAPINVERLLNQARYKIVPKKPLLLEGKKIVNFGDSVTEFRNYSAKIAELTGATVYKVGFGGCRMGKRVGSESDPTLSGYNELSMYRVANTVASQNFTAIETAVDYLKNNVGDDNTVALNVLKSIDFSTVDYVTIFYGTNDFTSDENPVGSSSSTDVLTMHGAVKSSINSLMTAYPNLKVIFITPTHRFFGVGNNDSDLVPNGLGSYLIEYCDAIKEQAHLNHLPVLDMYRESGFNKYNHNFYFEDGVHPNQIGDDYIGQKLSAFIQSLAIY